MYRCAATVIHYSIISLLIWNIIDIMKSTKGRLNGVLTEEKVTIKVMGIGNAINANSIIII